MPPFRVLHAAGLDPDAVLLKPPVEVADLCDDAPIAAIERLVSVAIERRADVVLLSCDYRLECISLSAEAALDEQFERLQDHEISVVLATTLEGSAWQGLANRESNVVILRPGESTRLTDREGRERAEVRCGASIDELFRQRIAYQRSGDVLEIVALPQVSVDELPSDFKLSHDYVACGRGPRQIVRQGEKVAHCPGVVQATSLAEAGSRGATLATIARGAGVELDFIPTASVRFETIVVPCELGDDRDIVALRMNECLNDRVPDQGEQAWIIEWRIEACDSLFEALNDPINQVQLRSQLPHQLHEVELGHRISIVPHPLWSALERPIAAEFAAALVEQESAVWGDSRPLENLGVEKDATHQERLAELVAHADRARVVGIARRFGMRVTTAVIENDNE